MNKKILTLSIILAFYLASCVNIRTPSPNINYYTLKPGEISKEEFGQVPGALKIRKFTISNEYDTEHIIAARSENRVKKYFYHRWLNNFSEMSLDYIIKTFSKNEIFEKGVLESTTYVLPDYILEGYVIELYAKNDENDAGENFVKLSMKFNFIKRFDEVKDPAILFNKVFTVKVERQDNKAGSIPRAFNIAMNRLTKDLIKEISKSAKE